MLTARDLLVFLIICVVGTNGLPLPSAYAQLPATNPSETTEEEADPEWPADSLGRRTPRGTVTGFIDAVAEEDYIRAARYLNLSDISNPNVRGAELAQTLQRLVDQQGDIISRSLISNNFEGRSGDDLPPDIDLVGTIDAGEETFNIYVEQTDDSDGGPLWLFSAQTLQSLPTIAESRGEFTVNQLLPDFLLNNRWGGVPIGHWLAMLVFVGLAYLLARAVVALAVMALRFFWKKAREEHAARIIHAFILPTRLFLAVQIFVFFSLNTGISIVARQSFSEVIFIVGMTAFLMLLWRLIDVFTRLGEEWLIRHGNQGGMSAVLFFRRSIKVLMIILGTILILDVLGLDVTTGLAALGIGGIALALGAQKTVENLVGSLTLIADHPIRVGDFCKIGDTTGTVERIGMRSTRIRTLDRTMVFIPNGDLASMKIENYAYRDRFWFHPVLALRYETTPDQIRYLLVELRAILYAHPRVSPDPARVRFIGLGADSLSIEIFAYVHASDYSEFLEVQEDLTLRIMDVVAESGADFAFPSQTIYMARDSGVSEEKTRVVEQKVRDWEEKGELQIPKFDVERINKLRNSIDYPPKGSSAHHTNGKQP